MKKSIFRFISVALLCVTLLLFVGCEFVTFVPPGTEAESKPEDRVYVKEFAMGGEKFKYKLVAAPPSDYTCAVMSLYSSTGKLLSKGNFIKVGENEYQSDEGYIRVLVNDDGALSFSATDAVKSGFSIPAEYLAGEYQTTDSAIITVGADGSASISTDEVAYEAISFDTRYLMLRSGSLGVIYFMNDAGVYEHFGYATDADLVNYYTLGGTDIHSHSFASAENESRGFDFGILRYYRDVGYVGKREYVNGVYLYNLYCGSVTRADDKLILSSKTESYDDIVLKVGEEEFDVYYDSVISAIGGTLKTYYDGTVSYFSSVSRSSDGTVLSGTAADLGDGRITVITEDETHKYYNVIDSDTLSLLFTLREDTEVAYAGSPSYDIYHCAVGENPSVLIVDDKHVYTYDDRAFVYMSGCTAVSESEYHTADGDVIVCDDDSITYYYGNSTAK